MRFFRKAEVGRFPLMLLMNVMLAMAGNAEAEPMSSKERAVVPIAAFTASGDIPRLEAALVEGLEAGLTVNEIKEVQVQMYAYAGFPRSLNGLGAFERVLKERQARGVSDPLGREASALPEGLDRNAYGARVRADLSAQREIPPPAGYAVFAPVIDDFLKEHLFADIFARDVLDRKTRELATISALASLTGTEAQLHAHLGLSLNVGWSEAQLSDYVSVLKARVGVAESKRAAEALRQVLESRR